MGKNYAPVAGYDISKLSVSAQDPKVILDASTSTDENPNAVLKFFHKQLPGGPVFKIIDSTYEITEAELIGTITENTFAMFEVKVTDRGGKYDTAEVRIDVLADVIVPPLPTDIIYLAKITRGTFADQEKALESLGVTGVRPDSIALSSYNITKARTDDFLEAGYICFTNICWENPTPNTVIPFYKDLVNYKNKLVPLAEKYAPWADKGMIRFLIENEETNRGYFSSPIEDYIELLKVAIEVCEQYKIPVSDGGLAAEYVQMLVDGDLAAAYERLNSGKTPGRYDEQMIKTDKLLSFFKTVTYYGFVVIIHTMGSGTEYNRTNLKAVVDYIYLRTGKQTGCNEFHVVDATKSLVDDMVQDFKDSGCIFVGIWDEQKGQDGSVTNGEGELMPVGIWFRDAIK